jgi:hypothetical protein
MAKKVTPLRVEHWKNEPESHDYPAASSYLGLVLGQADTDSVVAALQQAPLEHHQAKDLLRASSLDLLPEDNAHVAADLKKVRRGERLSPVLLVRGSVTSGIALTIADGYHRVCASYHLDENAEIPCRMADMPPVAGSA